MKPKTKLQKTVLKLSRSLPPLTEHQRQSAIRKIAPHIAKYNSKKEYVCLDCGHSWTGEKSDEIVCPHCAAKLRVDAGRKWNYCDKNYFAVVTTCQGFQVIRMFFMQTNLRRGQAAAYWIGEAFQRWLTADGKVTIVGLRRHWLSRYCDMWDWGSEMQIRTESTGHMVAPTDIVGQSSIIPEIKRNGFNGDYHNCTPFSLFMGLLADNRIETAWKVGQYSLVRYALSRPYRFSDYWPSIKVAIRHKYHIKDPSLWRDLLSSLEYCDKDILNPKFICPKDLKKAHDEWGAKSEAKRLRIARRAERERELKEERRYLENIQRVHEDEAQYKETMSKYFDLEFLDKDIAIRPLVSVREFIEEGHSLHHCVFSNGYYKKRDVLILHAIVNGSSVATIEFSLESFSVLQCRGVHNKKPELYDRIMSLIKKNIPQIMSKRA